MRYESFSWNLYRTFELQLLEQLFNVSAKSETVTWGTYKKKNFVKTKWPNKHHFLIHRKIGFVVISSFIIDWPASKIFILFYKIYFFSFIACHHGFSKISKSWNLAYLRILLTQKQCSKFQNSRLSRKKVTETQKCTRAAWPPHFFDS